VLWSIDWQEGDEIIISDQEHPALLLPVYNLHRRFGVKYRLAPVGERDAIVDEVIKRLSPRTRLVAMSHVSRQSGQVVPARELANALREKEVPLLLDGAQGPGNVPINFHDMGCDYYSLCGHKWLLGPKGTGALLVRKDRLESTPVSWTGAHALASMEEDGDFSWHPDARRYEFATRNQAGFGGWAESLRWLDKLGWAQIHERIAALLANASEVVMQSDRFELVSPREAPWQNGIVVIRLPSHLNGVEMYHRLREEDDMLVSPVNHPQDLRVCLDFYNLEQEFDALLGRLRFYSG
jgi:selenocysteine lyase/cysteine desulfurase